MRQYLLFAGILTSLVFLGSRSVAKESAAFMAAADTVPLFLTRDTNEPAKTSYSSLEFMKSELLRSAPGTKSVLFNSTGTRLYAMNLEGMSIYEFDQASRKLLREFRFQPTPGMGWDYENDKAIPSFQEKPVEACLTHDDKILWVSLHNAEGIVPIRLDSVERNTFRSRDSTRPAKKVWVVYPDGRKKESFFVPLIHTGKTPKIISRTGDSRFLLVSNWHSYSVSVVEILKDPFPTGNLVSNIPVPAIPRGIVVDDRNKKSYVAIMGGSSLEVIHHDTWQKDTAVNINANPRHIVIDTNGRLFVSYNKSAQIACVDLASRKTIFTAPTHTKPRTISLSRNQKFLFVTCYGGDTLDVFRIREDRFEPVASLPCAGHPVGVDIFEDPLILEAWVCSYTTGSIRIFSFRKKE